MCIHLNYKAGGGLGNDKASWSRSWRLRLGCESGGPNLRLSPSMNLSNLLRSNLMLVVLELDSLQIQKQEVRRKSM